MGATFSDSILFGHKYSIGFAAPTETISQYFVLAVLAAPGGHRPGEAPEGARDAAPTGVRRPLQLLQHEEESTDGDEQRRDGYARDCVGASVKNLGHRADQLYGGAGPRFGPQNQVARHLYE